MKSVKIMLMGIAVILFGAAISTMNFIGWCCGGAGLLPALLGLMKGD